jgi:hypothetical protein
MRDLPSGTTIAGCSRSSILARFVPSVHNLYPAQHGAECADAAATR